MVGILPTPSVIVGMFIFITNLIITNITTIVIFVVIIIQYTHITSGVSGSN